jgi:hypothetical protein
MAAPVVTVFPKTVLLNTPIAVTDLFDATAIGEPITSYTFFDSRSTNDTGFFTLNGSAIANGAPFTVTPEQLSSVFYVASSQVGFERIGVLARNRVGEFSQAENLARVFSVRANTTTPFVSRPDFEVVSDEAVRGSEFLLGFDPDGFPITEFEINDASAVTFLQATPGRIWVGAFQHNFETGESVTVQNAADSTFNVSGVANFHTENIFWLSAPGVTPGFGDISGATTFANSGGFFEYEGVAQDRGTSFRVDADKVDELVYQGVGPADRKSIFLSGFDGAEWSLANRGEIVTRGNENSPFVQFTRSSTPAGTIHNFTDSLSVNDADGNTVKLYRFFNTSPHANHGELVFKGQTIPRLTWIDVAAEDLQRLEFHTTNNINVEQLIRVQAFDGKFNSAVGTHAIATTPEIVVPEISGSLAPIIAEHVQTVPVASVFSQSDNGEAHTLVQVYDPTANPESGSLRFSNTPLAAGVVHEFAIDEFNAGLDFVTGEYLTRQTETYFQRNSNGLVWSAWQKVDIKSEPEIFDAFENIGGPPASWNGILPTGFDGKLQISFSFMQEFPNYNTGEAIDGNPLLGQQFEPLDDQQRRNVRLAFDSIEEYLNVDFFEVADTSTNSLGGRGGIMRFGEYGLPSPPSFAQAFAFFPSTSPSGGDIWVNRLLASDPQYEFGGPGFRTLLHEIGHVLGQQHAFSDGIPGTPDVVLPPVTENDDFTVLSSSGSQTDLDPTTHQLYDIFRNQNVYGANTNFNTGDDVYQLSSFDNRPRFLETLWDAGGIDTLSGAENSIPSVIDIRQGEKSTIGDTALNLTLAFGVEIENATGSSFDDLLVGNYLENHIQGGLGDDVIIGNQGNDLLTGAEGNDRFVWGIGDHSDTINENALAGRDTIEIPNFPNVDNVAEDVTFTLNGRDLLIDLTIDGGPSEGTMTVVNQVWGGFRVESLEIGDQKIDLVNLTSQLSPGEQRQFETLATASDFGSLVTPI